MIEQSKLKVRLNNDSFSLIIKYNNHGVLYNTAYSHDLMDRLVEELKEHADEIVTEFLKKKNMDFLASEDTAF